MNPFATPSPTSNFPIDYHVGGSLLVNDPTYVERQADRELYETVKSSQFCYVFNSRQMGKSSVRVQVMQRLQSEGIACAAIDLSSIGSSKEVTPKKWYAAVIRNLISSFGLGSKINLRTWLRERSSFTQVELLASFIETILLVEVTQPIAIFIDEIDSVLGLQGFSRDDFFAFIRYCYNVRTDKPAFCRLTFVIIGVANPSDLMQDKSRTPFNIGCAIDLTGFTIEEAEEPLGKGLLKKTAHPERVLREILQWTGGQPFLTQKLCRLVQTAENEVTAGKEAEFVRQLVRDRILYKWEAQDVPEHLKTIRDRLVLDNPYYHNPRKGRILDLYKQVLRQGEIDTTESMEEIDLRLSGLVVKQENKIRCRNKIYKTIFNLDWVEQELENLRDPIYAKFLNAWLLSNCLDKTYLLEGKDLQDAKAWAKGKSLSDEDNQFLDASKENEKNRIENEKNKIEDEKNKIEDEKNRIEDEKNKIEDEKNRVEDEKNKINNALEGATEAKTKAFHRLKQAKEAFRKARQREKRAKKRFNIATGLFFILVVSAIVGGLEFQSRFRTLELERQRLEALREFENSSELEALVIAMKSAQKVKKWNLLKKAPMIESVLGQIFNGVEEKNQFQPLESSEIWSVSFSNNGKYLATGSHDGVARLWDLQGKLLKEFKDHQDSIQSVSFSDDSKYLATGSWDGKIIVWDLKGHIVHEFQSQDHGKIWSVSFSPDDQYLASSSDNGIVYLWNLDLDVIEQVYTTNDQGKVRSVSFSPDGKYLAGGSENGTINLWDLKAEQTTEKPTQVLENPGDQVYGLSFSSDGKLLASGSEDGTVSLWELQTDANKPKEVIRGHDGQVYSVQFILDDQQLLTSSEDGTVRLWDIEGDELEVFRGHKGAIWSFQFNPKGEKLVTGSTDGTIRLWNIADKEDLKIELAGHKGIIYSASFHPDGQMFATGSADKTWCLWNLQGELLQKCSSHDGAVIKVIFSPDGKTLATGSADGTARLWNLQGKLLDTFQGHEDWVWDVDFSPDGQQLVTSSSDGTVRLWDLQDNGHKPKLNKVIGQKEFIDDKGNKIEVWSVEFSPDGKTLATGSADNKARLWDLEGKLLALPFNGHEGWIRSIDFSTDGQHLATGSADGTVRLWNLQGKLLQEFENHKEVHSVSFSPNGKLLITGSADGTVRLWDLQGNQLPLFTDHQGKAVYSVSFHPDGKQILTASANETAYLWQVVGYEELINRGCEWLKNYLAIHPEVQEELQLCDK